MDYPVDIQEAISDWRALLGSRQVIEGDEVQLAYGNDTGDARRQIPAALRIVDRETLPDVLRIAHRHGVPVYPISTGKNWGYGTALPAIDGCVIIDLIALDKILHFDSEFGVITLEPGVTQGMLADFLEAGGYPFLVPVTGAGPTCSLLGNALERGYGVTPYTDHFNAVTDIEAVLADGSVYKSLLREVGGDELARLFKWGIGPYANGLFTQSGFGIVTRMSIMLARRPECVKVCLFSLKDDALLEPAVLRIRSIMGKLTGTVGAINLMNQHRVLSMTAPYPLGGLGPDGLISADAIASLGNQYQIYPWTGFGTLYGTRRMVAAAQKEIKATLGDIATRMMFLTPGRAHQLAGLAKFLPGQFGKGLQGMTETLAKSLELVAGRPNETALPLAYWRAANQQMGPMKNPAIDGCGLLWYAPLVPMRPADVRSYVNMIKQVVSRHGIEPLITFTSLSDKLFDSTVPLVFEKDRLERATSAKRCYAELLETGRTRGWFPYRLGIDAMSALASRTGDETDEFFRRLRSGIDPRGLISPGRYR
jgi:4-cresol dehydrogenase (hydroxylating)